MMRPGTSACALAAGIPTRKPARRAAASRAKTTRRRPSGPARTSGASTGGAAAPNVLRSRSVGQLGRKSETTRAIAGLHFEIGAFPGAATDQFELPPGASDARHRQGGCGEDADAPAGDGCRRLSEIGRLCRPPPAADGDADGAGAFGGKLKAAGGRHREPCDFCDDSAKAAMPQTFLETDEDRLFVARLDIDHAIGREPGLREGRGEQILPCDTPEHLTTQPRRDSCRKERRSRAVDRAMAAAGHLMQSAKCQSASRQMPVDRLDAEGQHRPPVASRALEALDARTKLFDGGTGMGACMALATGLENRMFYICSYYVESQSESGGRRRTRRLDLCAFFATSPVNTALAATLALLRTSKELSG